MNLLTDGDAIFQTSDKEQDRAANFSTLSHIAAPRNTL